MTQNLSFFQAGAHRGGSELHQSLVRMGAAGQLGEIVIADPKPGRARQQAAAYQRLGARTQALQQRCEDAVEILDHERPIAAVVDEVAPMAHLLATRTRQPVFAQGVGRGPGLPGQPAPAFGLAVAAFPERETDRRDATALFEALAPLSPPQSSQTIRVDPLNAMRLKRARRGTSTLTGQRLMELERTRELEDLHAMLWGGTTYPLVLARQEHIEPTRIHEQALDLVSGRGPVAIALFSQAPAHVELLVLNPTTRRDGHFVRLHIPFGEAAPPRPSLPPPSRSIIDVPSRTVSRPAPRPRPRRSNPPSPMALPLMRPAFTD